MSSAPARPVWGCSILETGRVMAKVDSKGNATSAAKGKTPRFNEVVFISFPLSGEQKEEIKAAQWDLEDMDNATIKLNEENYKVSFSYDEYSGAYAVFITPKGDKHHNAGFILTGRGSSPHKALKQAYYVHTVLFEGDWSGWKDDRKSAEIDD